MLTDQEIQALAQLLSRCLMTIAEQQWCNALFARLQAEAQASAQAKAQEASNGEPKVSHAGR